MTATTAEFLALDLSLRSTGWADGEKCGRIIPPNGYDGMRRIRWVRSAVLAMVQDADLVLIEGYAFSAHASHAHELGELGGVIRCALVDAGIRYVDVPPASLKLFATGKGNASKEQVLTEAVRRLGYSGHSGDESDALWLHQMAATYYAGSATNEAQRKGLAKIAWPVLEPVDPTPRTP
jgi:crossover junction endodeoxyribonuclease RuvC